MSDENTLSYDDLHRQLTERIAIDLKGSDQYFASNQNRDYYQIERNDFNPKDITGWKFHLSVNAEDIHRALPIVSQVLMDANAPVFKVAKPNTLETTGSLAAPQAGKVFVIYDTGTTDWQATLKRLESELEKANIRPGLAVAGDRPMNGSQFLHRRNDGYSRGINISAAQAAALPEEQRYNPNGAVDPFAEMDLTPLPLRSPEKLAIAQDGAARVASVGPWIEVQKGANPEMRLDVTDMIAEQRGKILDGMQRFGLPAKIYRSESIDRDFIRVTNPEDVSLIRAAQAELLPGYIEKMRPTLVVNSDGVYEYRINADNLNDYDRMREQNMLAQAGIKTEIHQGTNGTVIRTIDSDGLVAMDNLVRIARAPGSNDTSPPQTESERVASLRAADGLTPAERSAAAAQWGDVARQMGANADNASPKPGGVNPGAATPDGAPFVPRSQTVTTPRGVILGGAAAEGYDPRASASETPPTRGGVILGGAAAQGMAVSSPVADYSKNSRMSDNAGKQPDGRSTASLTTTAAASTPELRVGQGTVEQFLPTSQLRPEVAEISPAEQQRPAGLVAVTSAQDAQRRLGYIRTAGDGEFAVKPAQMALGGRFADANGDFDQVAYESASPEDQVKFITEIADPETLYAKAEWASAKRQVAFAGGAPITAEQAVSEVRSFLDNVSSNRSPGETAEFMARKDRASVTDAWMNFEAANLDNDKHGPWEVFTQREGWLPEVAPRSALTFSGDAGERLATVATDSGHPRIDVDFLISELAAEEFYRLGIVRGRPASLAEQREIKEQIGADIRERIAKTPEADVPQLLARMDEVLKIRNATSTTIETGLTMAEAREGNLPVAERLAMYDAYMANIQQLHASGMGAEDIRLLSRDTMLHGANSIRAQMNNASPVIEEKIRGDLAQLAERMGIDPREVGNINIATIENRPVEIGRRPSHALNPFDHFYLGGTTTVSLGGDASPEASRLLGGYQELLDARKPSRAHIQAKPGVLTLSSSAPGDLFGLVGLDAAQLPNADSAVQRTIPTDGAAVAVNSETLLGVPLREAEARHAQYNPMQDSWAIARSTMMSEMAPEQRAIAEQLMAQRRELLQNVPAELGDEAYKNAPNADARESILTQRMAYGESVDRIVDKAWSDNGLPLPEGFHLKPLTVRDRQLAGRMEAARVNSAAFTSDDTTVPPNMTATTGSDGPRASLAVAAGTDVTEQRVGQGTVEQLRTTAPLKPATADAPKYSPTAVVAANDGRAGQRMTDVADGRGESSAGKFMATPSASIPPAAANDIAPVADSPLPDAPAANRGGLFHTKVGSGAGLGMGLGFSVLRHLPGASMDTAGKVDEARRAAEVRDLGDIGAGTASSQRSNQFDTEIDASRADIVGLAPDAVFLKSAGAAKLATKLAPKAAPALQGLVTQGAKVLGPLSLLAAAGVTAVEMRAAREAQDGRREAGALYGLLGGVAGGAAGGAGGGLAASALAGPAAPLVAPWTMLIGGAGGAIAGGFLASEYGRRSQMGDQMQRNLDHQAQYAIDASIERIREIRNKMMRGEPLSDTDKSDVRTSYVAMAEQHARLEVLYVPETDIDGQLRRDFQMNQAAKLMAFLEEPSANMHNLPRTSIQSAQVASARLPALVEQINARDDELNWKQSLDQDRFGKKDGVVTVAEVVKAANEYGIDLYTLDKNGNGLALEELLSTLHAAGVDSNGVRDGRTFTPNTAPMIADSVHPSFAGRAGAVHLLETLDALHIPGLNGQQLRGIMEQYGISVAMLDLKVEGKINEGDIARAFVTNGVPKETLNGLADHIIKLVPRYREGAEVWDTNDARLEKLREELKQYAISSGADREADASRWNQARNTALDYLVNGGTSDDARFKLTRFSVNIISTLEMEKIGMLQFMDTNRDGKIDPDKEALPWLAKHKIQFSDTNGNNVIDAAEFAAALPANVRSMIDIEKARPAEVKIPDAAPTATPAVAETQPAPAPEEEIFEITVTGNRLPPKSSKQAGRGH